jgi:hypothetical protein
LNHIQKITDNKNITANQKVEVLKQEMYTFVFRLDQYNLQAIQFSHELQKLKIEINNKDSQIVEYKKLI